MNQRIDELRAHLREDPESRRFFLLGDLLRKAGELVEAAEVLTHGLEHHPRYVAAWVSLGRIQLENDQGSEAERSFARALELDPENVVAARLIGETAEKAGEWVRAIKAFKLARALTPGDAELEERIEKIERILTGDAGDGQPVKEEAAAYPETSTTVEPVTPPEVFEVEEADPEGQDPFRHAAPAPRPREVITISEDDPFSTTPTGDSGVWMVADDVFAVPVAPPETPPADVFGDEMVTEPIQEVEAVEVQPVEMVSEPGPTPEGAAEPVPEDEFPQDLSLSTVTLARLALEQNDLSLAEETLRAVLDRDPRNMEAADLLNQLTSEVVPETVVPVATDPADSGADLVAAKALRLKGWMQGIRAAAERRAP